MQDDLRPKVAELERRGVFLGGPRRKFVSAGRGQLEILLEHGLVPNDRVVDVGCGALRGGWWLINFLRPERYFGIEPNRDMLQAGIDVMVGAELLAEKRPTFSNVDTFDLRVFGAIFDFAIARSVWTHASRDQIRAMLRSFRECSHEKSLILTSIVEPSKAGSEYDGTGWIGKSHQSDTAGYARYRFATLRDLCGEEGFSAEALDISDDQRWIRVSRADAG
jgi:SAM-dependent methyltransferase